MNSIHTNTDKASSKDHYRAYLENGELVMTPFCACGNSLDDNYFCEKCNRQCRCYEIICEDSATLERVQAYIRKSPQFSVYKAHLLNKGQG